MFSFLRKQGNIAEGSATTYLQTEGLQIIARNFACKSGEIDIIALDAQKTLIFVEVKQRANATFGGGVAAVNIAKQKRIALAAIFYIKKNKPVYKGIRFDIISITGDNLEHIKNAFVPTNFTL